MKIYIQIFSFLIAMLSFATFPACEVDYKVEFLTDRFTEQKPGVNITDSTGYENGYAYVDLGLSVKWATMNVGASNPEDYGIYFAWGETQPKSTYDWSTYKWCNGSYDSLTKYNTNSSYGTVDNKTTLELSDDAARVNWGGSWRMPTDAEWTELREQCIWGWTTGKGIIGYTVISKSNGNRIFLPAAGYYVNNSVDQVGFSSNYWSSSLDTDSPYDAWFMYFHSDTVSRFNNSRTFGFSVRPVLDEKESVQTTSQTVYVLDESGFGQLNLYMWGDVNDLNGGWPGMAMTGTETVNGMELKYFDIGADNEGLSETLIFSDNGSNQLADYGPVVLTSSEPLYLHITAEGAIEELNMENTIEHDGAAVYILDGME